MSRWKLCVGFPGFTCRFCEKPRTVIGLGLVGLRSESAIVNGRAYTFRFQTTLIDDEVASILLWPNHPSRAPFAGRGGPGSRWAESVEEARLVLDRMRPHDRTDA